MPELRFETNIYGELTKGNWFNMNTEHKGADMAFSGTRALLMWCRQQTESYGEVNVINMTTSWRDGLAFCAIVHRFRPDLIDFDRLTKENIMENNELAFSMAEKHFGIPMVLDASDMVENTIPDRLSVITYVSQLYEYFKNRTPANQGYATKMNIQPKARAESKGHKGSKRASPSNQMYILSGHAKRVATALRNVFKSDPKEEPSKGKEHGHSSKYSGVDTMRTSLETSSRNSDEPSPSNTARKSPFLGNDCCICHSKVYIMERLIAERKLFHRACFRCDKCNACLRPGTYHYFPETDKFCCLFDCAGGQRETPIKIKLEPITNVAQEPHSPKTLSSKTSTGDPHLTDSPQQGKSSLQRQFSVVKRNTITLNALPQPLTQGNTNIAKSPKHLHSSKSPTLSRHKGEGEKKRRFSGSGRVKSKREGKEKFVREPGDQGKTSWSPEHKRRAPEIRLEDVTDDVTDSSSNKDEISKASLASSPKLYLLSSEEQVHVVVEANEEGLFSLRKTEGTKIAREDSMYEPPTENLFFSFKEELLKRAAFKEELLKRATRDEANDVNEDNKVPNENKLLEKDCKQGLRTTSHEKVKTGKDYDVQDESDFSGNYVENGDSNLTEENVVTADGRKCSHERRHSEDSSVKSDSTKGSGSRKGSVLDEVAPPVVPKSVQKLREKFLNINDIIDDKHRTNIAKKSSTVKRELRCVSAWKQQTDSHVATTRKLSANLAGKSAETRRPNIGSNRKSVKELRRMYMGSGGSEDKASKENFNRVRSQSTKETETKEISSESSQGEPENLSDSETKEIESETKDDSASSAAVNETEDAPGEGNECYDANDQIVVIHVDPSQGERQDEVAVKVINESLLSSQQNSTMSHETRTYTIIKSGDVPYNVPSLQIQPSSPESCNSEQRSPGLKRHAASHDSGIDMPSYAQNNVLTAVRDEKISAESLKVAAEFSFPGSGISVLTPSEQPSNVTGSDPQSPDIPLSPGSDFSPEVFWSLPLSVGNRASLTDTSSSCSSPRMSVIIAQEASTTKINSRFFTVESMEPWDFEDHRIAEEHQCVMEVEGEFYFGREKRRISRAEREAIFSLHREAKNHGFKATDLIKEEEITLSPSEIDSELQALEAKHGILEGRGVEIEHSLRESMDSEGPFNDCEDELLREWLSVVHERNKIMRRESELIYLLQSHNYEERYRTVEGELRKLVAMRDEVKSNDDLKKERGLLSELLELVQKRSFIVDSLEEERVREIQEDEKVEQALTDGIAALPGNCWDQRPDCTKVAFSRFYC